MNIKKIEQTITFFQIGAALCLIFSVLFYVYPITLYWMEYIGYIDRGTKEITKPEFPNLPPPIVAFPFFFAGIGFFFGAKFLEYLKRKDRNSNVIKTLAWLAVLIPLFSFSLCGYLIEHLPLSCRKIIGAETFEETFIPIQSSTIEDYKIRVRISKPEGWYAYQLDLNSKKALLIHKGEIQKDEPIDSAPYSMLVKYGSVYENPPWKVVAVMKNKFGAQFDSYVEQSNEISNLAVYPAIRVTSRYAKNGAPYHLEYWAMERNGSTYLIYYAMPEGQKENISIFETLIKNIVFI